ncbi:hypothetical protein ABZV93_06610 [Actinopolymorpha sp. NPDC004070]|uniref:hypothetical protein n=1 Tax=Actinopolymorpha sp. NPDC004070 TaxID=3154548 RepID=UPI0033AE3103
MGVQLASSRLSLVGGPFSFVGCLLALVGLPVALVGFAVALVGFAFAIVGNSFTVMGFAVALVGGPFPFVGDPFPLVAFTVTFVGFVVALVAEVIAFVTPAGSFVDLDVSEFFEPPARLRLHAADVGPAASFLVGLTACSVPGGAFVGGFATGRGGFTLLGREEPSSLRRSPAQPRGEHTCLGGSLPKAQCDPLPSGDFDRFVLPTVVGVGHISNVARLDGATPRPYVEKRRAADLRLSVDRAAALRRQLQADRAVAGRE